MATRAAARRTATATSLWQFRSTGARLGAWLHTPARCCLQRQHGPQSPLIWGPSSPVTVTGGAVRPQSGGGRVPPRLGPLFKKKRPALQSGRRWAQLLPDERCLDEAVVYAQNMDDVRGVLQRFSKLKPDDFMRSEKLGKRALGQESAQVATVIAEMRRRGINVRDDRCNMLVLALENGAAKPAAGSGIALMEQMRASGMDPLRGVCDGAMHRLSSAKNSYAVLGLAVDMAQRGMAPNPDVVLAAMRRLWKGDMIKRIMQ